ncbi:MAG TPA: hypothetical protein VK190_03115 [Pseudoneobacillus sp.]|jgi:hypothetical protein|nr:hypothetical protein [Pseudoneobacillus sp.]
MDFINNWSDGTVELRALNGNMALYFNSNDFIINSANIDAPATIEADWSFQGLDFGMIMKYNKNGFLLYTLNGSYATLSLVNSDSSGYYGHILQSTPYVCQLNSTITLSAEITDFTYKFYANGYLVFSTKYNDNNYRTGNVGLYSYPGNYCTEFRIKSAVPTGWTFDEPTDKFIGKLGDET